MNTYTTVIGRLTRNPELHKVGAKEITKVTLRVASNEGRRDPATQEWTEGEKLYVNVNCWRALGQNAMVFTTGDPVIVHGRLRTREWTTAEGDRRSVTELDATAVGPDLGKCVVTEMRRLRAEPPATPGPTTAASPPQSGPSTPALTDDDSRVKEPV